MNIEQLKTTFFDLIHPDLPNEWDVEEAVEALVSMSEEDLQAVFDQVSVIWPVSNSLCFSYFTLVSDALQCIGPELLPQWVAESLDQYEQQGLRAAQLFMQDIKGHFVCRLQGGSGLRFSEVEGRLLPYVRGLARKNIDLKESSFAGTDTATIFLPREISFFSEKSENFLLYKLTSSFQWGYLALNTFLFSRASDEMNPSPAGRLWLQEYFAGFAHPRIIADIYFLLETLRVRVFLDMELPGLMRDSIPLFTRFIKAEAESDSFPEPVAALRRLVLSLQEGKSTGLPGAGYAAPLLTPEATAELSLSIAEDLFKAFSPDDVQKYSSVPLPFQGVVELERIAAACVKKRNEQKSEFIDSLSTLLLTLPSAGADTASSEDISQDRQTLQAPAEEALSVIIDHKQRSEKTDKRSDDVSFITINNQEVELSEDLQELAREIIHDLGHIPELYISSAAGKAGQGSAGLERLSPSTGEALSAPFTYDEWDYRRSGFRKNWCIVTEKDIPVTRSTFIKNTLDTYHGQIIKLRHQFEMMRTRERFVRRQRDGDDIDFDAVVESLADTVAGHPPSDRLFVRLKRDERDIAALFLLDMSNSTRGWVGKALKEAIVLICEAMESLGDRYAIYGFSGMRRLRCEVFPVKNFDQLYDDDVRDKIGSIAPREYTRMAPAIRHMTAVLKDVDAKVRLLITLSDGKPEDYDDYKGEYAIEDTRHALIEAKMAGLHPFCITIDQHAHEYMAHMYGEVNYIFIDDVRKLPVRMPEIYRVLTS